VKRVGRVGTVVGLGGLVVYIHEMMLYMENLARGILLRDFKDIPHKSIIR
jgi:hypothetical protein